MATYNLPDASGLNFTQGPEKIFVYVAQEVPSFIPLLLVSLFILIFATGYLAQKKREGKGDGAAWFAIAGFITFIASLILSLTTGLISTLYVVICLSIALIGAIVFFLTKDKE